MKNHLKETINGIDSDDNVLLEQKIEVSMMENLINEKTSVGFDLMTSKSQNLKIQLLYGDYEVIDEKIIEVERLDDFKRYNCSLSLKKFKLDKIENEEETGLILRIITEEPEIGDTFKFCKIQLEQGLPTNYENTPIQITNLLASRYFKIGENANDLTLGMRTSPSEYKSNFFDAEL